METGLNATVPPRAAMQRVLVVDDEPLNLEIISEYLDEAAIDTVTAERGETGWSLLDQEPGGFDAVLLDRMMPGMDGIELLERIRADARLSHIPVIMQTAAAGREQVLEGLDKGAYYYLTKPFERGMLLSVLRGALGQAARRRELLSALEEGGRALESLTAAEFEFHRPAQARSISALLARLTPAPESAVIGLAELLINAVEHGNLDISYTDKTRLHESGALPAEIERRLDDPRWRDRRATVSFRRHPEHLEFVVRDQGKGFDWSRYLEISPERAYDSHGRGIAMAKAISFSELEYQGNGSTVRATIALGQ